MDTRVTREDLEAIRRVVIRYYEEKTPPFWEAFVEELRRGAIFLGESPAIGIWKYEEKMRRITLTRQPPVSPELRYFGVYLEKRGDQWTVVEEFQEVERLDLPG